MLIQEKILLSVARIAPSDINQQISLYSNIRKVVKDRDCDPFCFHALGAEYCALLAQLHQGGLETSNSNHLAGWSSRQSLSLFRVKVIML